MATVESQGTTFAVGDGASPEVFNNVGEVIRITGLRSGTAAEIDVTHLSSTAREFRLGLKDEGSMTVELSYDPSDTDGQNRLEALRDSRETGNFEITLPDGSPGTKFSFAGIVTQFPFDVGVDDVLRGSVTIRVTGEITKS